jgi:1,2-diacylglycerol 3-beta-glucosyltransferase
MILLVVGLLATILLLPTLSDLVSLLRLALTGRTAPGPEGGGGPPPRLLFLVPAHDEELLIADCVRSLVGLHYPAARRDVVVIADNCADATATIARTEGATALERTDAELRGKPRAIAWALERLPFREYDSVVIVDADTVVDPGFAAELARVPSLRGKAVQGLHGVRNPNDSALTRMAAVFATARYRFEFPLKSAAGLNVPLMGNGMALGSEVLATHGWTAFSICEDWEMYGHLTQLGVKIEGVPGARLYSQEARSLQQSASQRRRWAAGKITVLLRYLGPLTRSRAISAHQKFDTVAELTALGPAVHLGLVAALSTLLHLLAVPGATAATVVLLVPIARLGVYTMAALRLEPHPIRTGAAFLYLPFYTVWRLCLQVSALGMVGDKPWIRTERHR